MVFAILGHFLLYLYWTYTCVLKSENNIFWTILFCCCCICNALIHIRKQYRSLSASSHLIRASFFFIVYITPLPQDRNVRYCTVHSLHHIQIDSSQLHNIITSYHFFLVHYLFLFFSSLHLYLYFLSPPNFIYPNVFEQIFWSFQIFLTSEIFSVFFYIFLNLF